MEQQVMVAGAMTDHFEFVLAANGLSVLGTGAFGKVYLGQRRKPATGSSSADAATAAAASVAASAALPPVAVVATSPAGSGSGGGGGGGGYGGEGPRAQGNRRTSTQDFRV